jgi:hypothetical protein
MSVSLPLILHLAAPGLSGGRLRECPAASPPQGMPGPLPGGATEVSMPGPTIAHRRPRTRQRTEPAGQLPTKQGQADARAGLARAPAGGTRTAHARQPWATVGFARWWPVPSRIAIPTLSLSFASAALLRRVFSATAGCGLCGFFGGYIDIERESVTVAHDSPCDRFRVHRCEHEATAAAAARASPCTVPRVAPHPHSVWLVLMQAVQELGLRVARRAARQCRERRARAPPDARLHQRYYAHAGERRTDQGCANSAVRPVP